MTATATYIRSSRPPARTLNEHIRRTITLALPVMVARSGLVIMISVGIIMSGHAGPNEQAYLAAAFAPHMSMLVIGIGLMLGVTVLSAQADGAGHPEDCGRYWRLGLIIAAVIGLAYSLIMLFGRPLLLLLDQSEDIAAHGGRVLLMFSFGMPAMLCFVATSSFLESIGRPSPGMMVSLAANAINLLLCWIFVFGEFGMPTMGAAGSALALSITRWCMLIAILVIARNLAGGDHYGVRAPLAGHYHKIRKLLRVGLPLAVATGLESLAFSATTIMAGWLGTAPLAAFQDALNLNALIFMLAIGLATATSVRVANAVGRRDQAGIRTAGWVGAGLVIAITGATGIAIALTPEWIASIYTSNDSVRATLVPTLLLVAWVSVFDGLQCVLIGATRGTADTIVPTTIQGISFWVIMAPVVYYLGIAQGLGVQGMFWAIGISLVASSLMLAWRFNVLSRRVVAPI
ncbi:MAG: MATE family efflux transporter [Dongiaceae bacterium]